jgi:hypothetical protein
MWKARLERCIETGVFDTPVNIVEMDNECYFGKWLYGEDITPTIRNSEEYKRVKDCHARFHRVAAKVVELSLSGKKTEAANLMSSSGEYTKITTELVKEMMSWADNIE